MTSLRATTVLKIMIDLNTAAVPKFVTSRTAAVIPRIMTGLRAIVVILKIGPMAVAVPRPVTSLMATVILRILLPAAVILRSGSIITPVLRIGLMAVAAVQRTGLMAAVIPKPVIGLKTAADLTTMVSLKTAIIPRTVTS